MRIGSSEGCPVGGVDPLAGRFRLRKAAAEVAMLGRFRIGDFLRGAVFQAWHGLLLALLGWCLVAGCLPSTTIGPGGAGADFTTTNADVRGLRFEPSFVRKPELRLPPSNVCWVFSGEQVLVKWEDFHVVADVGEGPSECHLCAAMAADAQGMVVCHDPEADSYLAAVKVQEIAASTPQGPVSPTDLQDLGPFFWWDGCFIPGASPAEDSGPENPPSFTATRSGQWAAGIVDPADPGRPTALNFPRLVVVVLPSPTTGRATATIWVIPTGGSLTMPPRKLNVYELRDAAGNPLKDAAGNPIPDPNHWLWNVGPIDFNGQAGWDENFAPGLVVGKVRIVTGQIVGVDPASQLPIFMETGKVIPYRVRVYERIDFARSDPFASDIFYCLADRNAPNGDGDIDLTRCRSGSGTPTRQLITPAYDRGRDPPQDQPTRVPLTWIVEFDATSPPPTEQMWIEFTLCDAAAVRPQGGCP